MQDINDLIKSMTLRDLDGGAITAVSYDSNVPVERTLQSFAVNLTGNPGFGVILNQARGEKVEVVLQQANATQPGTLTGSIVGVEKKQQQIGKDVVTVECLNLWCSDGMRSVKLADVSASASSTPSWRASSARRWRRWRRVTTPRRRRSAFSSPARATQRQGRLRHREPPVEDLLPPRPAQPRSQEGEEGGQQAEEKKPYLQGWAVVENQTDEDWNGVHGLISGGPSPSR